MNYSKRQAVMASNPSLSNGRIFCWRWLFKVCVCERSLERPPFHSPRMRRISGGLHFCCAQIRATSWARGISGIDQRHPLAARSTVVWTIHYVEQDLTWRVLKRQRCHLAIPLSFKLDTRAALRAGNVKAVEFAHDIIDSLPIAYLSRSTVTVTFGY